MQMTEFNLMFLFQRQFTNY